MKVGAIIAAAGFGRRMKADRPKQLLALNGIPIIIHTIRKFDISRVIDYIIVTAPRESVIEVSELVKSAEFQKPVIVVQGGERRQDSVASGLNHLQPGTDIVAVHDGVRPFVSTDDIENAVRQAERTGAAVLAVPIVGTGKHGGKDVIDSTLTREKLVEPQTPQGIWTESLKKRIDPAHKGR